MGFIWIVCENNAINGGGIYMANYDFNPTATGIRITFDRKPSGVIRSRLKKDGWRWNKTMNYWYHWWSQAHQEFAKEICCIK